MANSWFLATPQSFSRTCVNEHIKIKRSEVSDQLQSEGIWHYKTWYKLVRIQRFQITIFSYRSLIHIEYRLTLLSLISIYFQIKLLRNFYIKLKRIIILFSDKTFINKLIYLIDPEIWWWILEIMHNFKSAKVYFVIIQAYRKKSYPW